MAGPQPVSDDYGLSAEQRREDRDKAHQQTVAAILRQHLPPSVASPAIVSGQRVIAASCLPYRGQPVPCTARRNKQSYG